MLSKMKTWMPLADSTSAAILAKSLLLFTYITPKLTADSKASKSAMKDRKTPHSFVATASTATAPVTIRVTDASGKVLHEETLIRPKTFNKDIQ